MHLIYFTFKRVECRRATSLCVSNSNVNNIINEKDTIRNLIAYTETLKGYEVQEHGLCVIIHKRWLGALTPHQWMRYLWIPYFWSYLHFHCSFLTDFHFWVSFTWSKLLLYTSTHVGIHPCYWRSMGLIRNSSSCAGDKIYWSNSNETILLVICMIRLGP